MEAPRSAAFALILILVAAACGGTADPALAGGAADGDADAAGAVPEDERLASTDGPGATRNGPDVGDDAVEGENNAADMDLEVLEDDPETECEDEQIDVNGAGPDELERIVHIGPARAEQVEELRPFANLRDLTRVPGIGDKRLSDITDQNLACVGSP